MSISEKQKNARKKKAIVFICIILTLLIILPVASFVDWDTLFKKEKNVDEDSWIVFYDTQHFVAPNFDIVPEDDEQYMQKDRFLHYSANNESFTVRENPENYGIACKLFYDYFELVKAGDFNNYYSLFTDEYAKKHGDINFFTKNKLIFTKQKIYDIEVELLRREYLENGDASGKYKGATVYYFDVSYRIKDNDGTFRRDMRSDEAVPLVFELLEKDGKISISNISFYKPSNLNKD